MSETSQKNPGARKDDQDKVDPSFAFEYFPRALLAVSRVSMFGEKKYARGGWRHVDDGFHRYTAAHDRHRLAEQIEGLYDLTDSELLHAAQVAWNALARLELMLYNGVPECISEATNLGGSPSQSPSAMDPGATARSLSLKEQRRIFERDEIKY